MTLDKENDLVESLLLAASRKWGKEEAKILRLNLGRIAEAIKDVQCFELDPDNEPWIPLKEG